ncbi:30S ribosomal protein S12 [Mycoplasmopsis caviae]|uniref:30S ribosomal protein S12 n=1 Tax=Mycoplasmopsis caviae TaxID=55603 RepID=A0A3P8MF01_9BACT|nr:30S ribosomal protein S12 [Mycoplasmopsis caviae]
MPTTNQLVTSGRVSKVRKQKHLLWTLVSIP